MKYHTSNASTLCSLMDVRYKSYLYWITPLPSTAKTYPLRYTHKLLNSPISYTHLSSILLSILSNKPNSTTTPPSCQVLAPPLIPTTAPSASILCPYKPKLHHSILYQHYTKIQSSSITIQALSTKSPQSYDTTSPTKFCISELVSNSKRTH